MTMIAGRRSVGVRGMNDSGEWDALVQAWQKAQDAVRRFPLVEDGTLQTERLDEYNRLDAEERAAKAAIDDFIEAMLNRGGG